MATPQPVVLTCLKLPPDEQLFFRLRAILLIVVDKFHQLDLALLAAETQADSDILTELTPLRVGAGHRSTDLIAAINYAKGFGERLIRLANSMTTPSATEDFELNLFRVVSAAELAIPSFRLGETQMRKISQDIEPAVCQITTILEKSEYFVLGSEPALNEHAGGTKASSLVLTPENMQAVNELVRVAEEYVVIHGKIISYFEEMEKLFHPKNFQGGTPSEEEVTFVRERWQGFIQRMANFQDSLLGIQTKIIVGPNAAEALRLAQEGPAATGPAENRNTVTSREAIMDSNDTTGATHGSQPPRPSLRTHLQTFLRRVLSCLSLRPFG
ncbi:hypothetical protein AN958_06847 [Leucoagaricus sp. SymC.cos]|nr:hypothetical protein AN958_06847 [Leucoagaricus sp. SymC.cos]